MKGNQYETAVLAHLAEVSIVKREFLQIAHLLAQTDEIAAGRVVVNTMRLTRSTAQLLQLLQKSRGNTP